MQKELWESMSQKDREMYVKIKRTLLANNNIVMDRDDSNRQMYLFVSNRDNTRYLEAMKEDFFYDGFEILLNRDYKFIHLFDRESQGYSKVNRVRLSLKDSLCLCCLWLIYIEKISSNTLRRYIVIDMQEFITKLSVFNIKIKKYASGYEKSFILFKKYGLIDYSGKPNEEDFSITIYPTIQFALDQEGLKKIADIKRDEYSEYFTVKKSITDDVDDEYIENDDSEE